MALRAIRRPPRLPSPANRRPISHSDPSPPNLDPSVSGAHLAHHLLEEFSKSPALRNDARLRDLAPRLTTDAVEAVLRDLSPWTSALDFFRWAASSQHGFRHSCYTYNALASVLARARQKSLLKSLAGEILNLKCRMTPGALGFLIRCVGSQGLVGEANSLFENARDLSCVPNSYTYNCLMEVLARMGEVGMVEMRLQELREPDKYTLTAVLRCYCNASATEKVWKVFREMNDRGWVDEHVFTILIVSFCKWGKVVEACELVERVDEYGMKLNNKTFSVLVHGFVKQGCVDKALEMFERMKKAGFKGDLALYGVLIQGLCNGGEFKRVFELYVEMKKSGVYPDVQLIKKMISSFCGVGDDLSAKFLLEEEGERVSFCNLVLLYNAVLDGLVGCGEVERAHLLLKAMMASHNPEALQKKEDECGSTVREAVTDVLFGIKKAVCPNNDSFGIVVCGLCKAQKLDNALLLLDDMIAIGCRGKLLMYNNLINELCNVDRLEEGYEVLRKMREASGFEPTEFTYNSIFYCLCKRGDSLTAIDLLKEMRHRGHVPWIKNCTLMVVQLCEHGKTAQASVFLEDMVKLGFLPDMITYSAAIDGMCSLGDMDKALKLFRDVSANGYLPDVVAHNILINGFCKSGRLTDAEEILNEMLDRGLVPSVVTYNLMIDGWCKAGRVDKALSCFSKMEDESRPPTVVTYTSLIDGLFSIGRSEDALRYWNEMKEKGCLPNKIAYIAMVHGLCKCGQADTALPYFLEMKAQKFELDTSVYFLLINSLILAGNSVVAFELLKEVIENVKYLTTDSKDYRLMIKAISQLYEDTTTSLDLKGLIDSGCIPLIRSIHHKKEDINK